ncbi:MAG: PaaI family thioesterase [Proteobacteria bacterium]|jgi:acyl-CoA thioesterase|nr:PaaI family thioesterase [Pseudomonadota bacterium]
MNEQSSPATVSELMAGLGLRDIVSLDPEGRAVLAFEVQPHHCHAVAQGGYVTAWIDAAMARAVGAATAGEFGCNTLEIKVAFYRPALVGQVLTAQGWVERLGRSVVFLEGDLRDAAGTVLAKGSSTARLGHFKSRESG